MGSLFPITTVSIQNAVPPNQLGTATGTMNFFRSLAGALMVSIFGTIVLGSSGGVTVEALVTDHGRSGSELAHVFGWVFAAAALSLVIGLLCLLAMEERPLRGRAQPELETEVAAE